MSSDQDVQREIEQLEQRFAENSRGLVFAHLADAYRRAHEYAKAEGLILHGLKNHPSYISAYNVLGRIYLDSDRLADAHAQFTRVLELDPHNLIALRALGDLAAKEDRTDEARAWYEQMLQVDPRNDAVREELRKLSAAPGGGAGAEPETTASDAWEAASTTHPGSAPQMGEGPPSGADASEAPAREVEGSEAGVFDIVAGGDLVDEIPDLATESDARSLEAMPWEDIRDVASLDLEASTGIDEGTADRTAVEPEEVEAESAESVELEGRLQARVEPDGSGETIDSEEGSESVAPPARDAEMDLSELDNWMPGLFEREPERGEEAEVGGAELEADNFIDALERGFDRDAERDEEEDEAGAQRAQGGGLITETMAELYARQGLHAEALSVYRKLLESRPGNSRLRQRIADLEERLALDEKASQESEMLELLDITGMADQPGGASGGEEVVEESAAPDLEPWGEAAGEGPSHPTGEAELEISEEEGTEGREGEPNLEELTAAASFAGEFEEPSGEEEFHFADEVPVAGLEQLDPFAVSFEIIGRGGEPTLRGDGSRGVQAGPVSDEGEPVAADTASGDIDEAPQPEDATAAMAFEETESLWSAEEEVAAGAGSSVDAVEVELTSGEAETAETTERVTEDAPTIERYLFGLLDFDPEAHRGDARSHANSTPPGNASAPAAQDPDEENDMVTGSNDLEQFQEWLRGLRH